MTKGTVTVSIMHILLTIYLETIRKLVGKKKDVICNVIFVNLRWLPLPGGDLGYGALRDKRTESTKQRNT